MYITFRLNIFEIKMDIFTNISIFIINAYVCSVKSVRLIIVTDKVKKGYLKEK